MNITLFINSKEQQGFHEFIDPIALEIIFKERKETFAGFDIRKCGYWLKSGSTALACKVSTINEKKEIDTDKVCTMSMYENRSICQCTIGERYI